MPVLELALVGRRRVFLESLAMWLGDVEDVTLVGGVTEPETLLGGATVPRVDVALVDLRLPTGVVLDVAIAMRAANPYVALVAMAEIGMDHRATAVVRAGFTGWVSEEESFDEVVATLRGVQEGRTRVPVDLLVRAVHQMQVREGISDADQRLALLTVREREVLDMLADGLDKRSIAARLLISPNTVRTHQQHVLGKLRVHSTLAAVSALRASSRRSAAAAGGAVLAGPSE